jgi:hypothetical protein
MIPSNSASSACGTQARIGNISGNILSLDSSGDVVKERVRVYRLPRSLVLSFCVGSSRPSTFDAGALTRDERFTPLGALLANLPVDVSAGKLLVLGSLFHVSGPAITVAAGMAVQSPFVRTATGSGAEQMKDARAELVSVYGDPFTLLNVFGEWLAVRDERGVRSLEHRRCAVPD